MIRKKKKVDTLSSHKKKAWKTFSLYIRTRDCLKSTGYPDRGTCITCKREYDIHGGAQAGHFIAGRGNSLLFDERNCHLQCYGCNVGKNGAYVEYFIFMEETYGREVIDEIRALRHMSRKFTKEELDTIEEIYRCKYEELIEEGGL